MTANEINNRENGVRKLGDPAGMSADANGPNSIGRDDIGGGPGDQPDDRADDTTRHDAVREATRLGATDAYGDDTTRHDAVREATRLGATDAYLVDQDMEDIDQREDQDGPDGRPSPLANADNPER
jgi:hypothetical protein